MKKSLLVIAVILVCLSAASFDTNAWQPWITVTVSGEHVYFDQQPLTVDGRILVPIRAVCDKIGAVTSWSESTQTATVSKDGVTLKLQIGSNIMQVSGESPVQLDVPPRIYNGRVLLPIRHVVSRLGYTVKWVEDSRTVEIEETGVAIVPGLYGTQVFYTRNWAGVSQVQQFAYKDEGIAYAYINSGKLVIHTPERKLTLDMRYPILGDVIADADGNIYIVWGKTGTTNSEQTVFISKYLPDGSHVKTTGFTGESTMGANGNTKRPFHAGNCDSAIGDGKLIVNYAREMYNGHQSNNVIGVNISDMSPVSWGSVWNIPYTSHSFNQSVIWSQNAGGFVYADHGDAYGRGFIVTTDAWERNLFHFYLEANVNYNMHIVNRTFAQLGGLAEMRSGVALVGASAKSISEAAKSERQNLFVQIFDPLAPALSPSMFVGGTARSGAMSMNIYDTSNSPLTSVTDYGVHWLTNYSTYDAVAPHVVSAGDNLVILWSANNNSYYMVLSADGEVVKHATSLGKIPLNSYEKPVYHDGAVYWAAAYNGRLKVRSIDISDLLPASDSEKTRQDFPGE